jgi:diguanylate cyclase (GGDEF)-like protein
VCRIALEIAGYVNVLAVVVDDDKPLRVVTAVGKWSGREGELERMLAENLKLGRGVITQAVSGWKPAIRNDLRESSPLREAQDALLDDDVRAIGAFPLVVDERCVGALAFDSAEAGYFDDEEIGLLTDLTNNLSVALGHLRRQARLARLSRMRDVLSAVNAAIVRIRDRIELFGDACRIAVEVGGFANAMLAEIDLESRQIAIPFSQGRSDRAVREETLQWRVSDKERGPGNIESSIRLLRPVVDNDVQNSDNWAFYEGFASEGIQAVGSFPIVVDGRAAGAMVFETEVRGFFDAEEIDLLTNLTNNIAFGLNLLEKQKRVEYLSYYDALTGLPNRTLFYDRLGRDCAACKKAGKWLALAIIDISRFSLLNNTLGEHVGDEVLRRIAARLREFVGEDRIARIGGDEFAVSFPMIDDLSPVATLVTSEGIKLFQAPFTIQNRELQIASCAGCAVFPSDGEGPQELFQNAEAALLSAKTSGATYRLYSPELNVRLAKELDLEARLQRAIEDREFVLYYQPKVETVSRKIVGFEGLLRWNDPERGLVPPGMFIPMLERTGMIIPVGRWALIEAARQYERWRRAGLNPPRVAINLSAVQLREGPLLDDVRSAIARFEEGCGLDLEVTESMLVDNIGSAIVKLTAIRALGPHISLDDFGTGYSSLAYLHQLPLNALKIDRSFITGMLDDVSKRGIVSTIIALGHALSLTTIAEGVEIEQDARLLDLLGCDQIQGYLISKPLPPDEAALLLTSEVEKAESGSDDYDS